MTATDRKLTLVRFDNRSAFVWLPVVDGAVAITIDTAAAAVGVTLTDAQRAIAGPMHFHFGWRHNRVPAIR